MKQQSLYILKSCLEDAAFAGTDALAADLRLRQAAEAFAAHLTEASDVEILRAAQALLTAEPEARPGYLLDALTLVTNAMRAAAETEVSGALTPLAAGGGVYVEAAYSRLRPLIDALTGSGGARVTILEEAWAEHREYFFDSRVQPYLAAALGDTDEEVERLLAAVFTALGRRAAPCLKDGFAPDGKREMVRRAYWVARLCGASENDWLLSVLPESRGEVREAVIAALGVSQDNAPLLLELYHSESGKCRDAALRALAWMSDEASRTLWTEELDRRPDCPPCLEGVESPLAADMAALVLRDAFSEALARERRELDRAELLTLAHAVYAAYGKYSEALRREWLWCAEQIDALDGIRPGRGAGQWDLTAAEMLEKCLLETVLWDPSEEVRALARELAALLAELLSPDASAFDAYGKYIVKNGFLHRENAVERARRVQIMRALAAVRYTREDGRHIPFLRKDALNGVPAARLYHLPSFDPRWAEALADPRVNRDGMVFDLGEPWSMRGHIFDLDWIGEPPQAEGAAEKTDGDG